MKLIIIENRDGEAIGCDSSSGGYAVLASHLLIAEDYAAIWNKKLKDDPYDLSLPLTVRKIEIDVKLARTYEENRKVQSVLGGGNRFVHYITPQMILSSNI